MVRNEARLMHGMSRGGWSGRRWGRGAGGCGRTREGSGKRHARVRAARGENQRGTLAAAAIGAWVAVPARAEPAAALRWIEVSAAASTAGQAAELADPFGRKGGDSASALQPMAAGDRSVTVSCEAQLLELGVLQL